MSYVDPTKRIQNDLSVIWPYVSMPRNLFELYYGETLSRFYNRYPVSVPFPLVEHILRLKSAYIIPENVSIETRYRVEEQWVFALFILGLSRSINLYKTLENSRDATNWLTVILDERSLQWIGSDVGLALVECLVGNFSDRKRLRSLIVQAEIFSNTSDKIEKNDQLLEQLESHISDLHSQQKLSYNRASSSIFSFPDGFFIYRKFFKNISLLTNIGNISSDVLIDQLLSSETESFQAKKFKLVKGAKKKIIEGYFLQSELPTSLELEITSDFSEI